jgi:Ras-related protein Rab-1A
MNIEYNYIFKIILVGNSNVGKSSIILRFTDGTFSEDFVSTIGLDFRNKILNIDDRQIKLQIWDTAGQEKFRTISSFYYKGAHGIILVYDVTNRNSFKNSQKWLDDILPNCTNSTAILLIGNKSDMDKQREVLYEEGKQLADEYNLMFIETSAKDRINIDLAFRDMAIKIKNKIIDDVKINGINGNDPFLQVSNSKKKSCC